jgi:hypothetical protein
MFQESLAEIDQRGRVKGRIAQLPVERKIPSRMVFEHFDGSAVRFPVQELKDINAQQQHRFDSRTTVLGTVAGCQLRAHFYQAGIDQGGE